MPSLLREYGIPLKLVISLSLYLHAQVKFVPDASHGSVKVLVTSSGSIKSFCVNFVMTGGCLIVAERDAQMVTINLSVRKLGIISCQYIDFYKTCSCYKLPLLSSNFI